MDVRKMNIAVGPGFKTTQIVAGLFGKSLLLVRVGKRYPGVIPFE
jgi:hypothetical protein